MAEHIKPLTALRGVAALNVLLHNFLLFFLPQIGNAALVYTHFFHNGYLWVDFFFILSGFILTHVYETAFPNKVSVPSYRAFLFSRFARIYPLHLFMILPFLGIELLKILVPSTQPFTGPKSLTGLLTNLFLIQVIDLKSPPLFGNLAYWNEPAWSISAEWFAYLVFPFLLIFFLKKNPALDIVSYLAALVTLFIIVIATFGHLDFIGLPGLARCILECIMGILTYKAYQRNLFERYFNSSLSLLASIAWIFLVMHYNWFDMWIIPAFCLLILSAAAKNEQSRNPIAAALNSRLMIYIGTISYSIYMVHWFIKDFFGQACKQIFHVDTSNLNIYMSGIILTGSILIVLLASSLAYHFIEMPMQKKLRNMPLARKYIYRNSTLLKPSNP